MNQQHTPTKHRHVIRTTAALLTVLCGISTQLRAGELTLAAPLKPEPSIFDKTWSLLTLYKDKENPVIQEFAITGRYHGQYSILDSSQGGSAGQWEHRRFRVGGRMTLFHDFELKAEIFGDLNAGGDFYEGLTEAYLAWKPIEAFNLTVGKQKPRFSLDWSTSSREILTFERNILINNFGIDYESGVSVSGKSGAWSYYAGAFNNDVGDTGGESEFGDLSGGFSYVASLGYDFRKTLGVEKANVRLDYLHTQHDADDDLLLKFTNSVAASFALKQGRFSLATEALYAEGDTGDAWGLYFTPAYDITSKLQIVARYTFARSDDDILRAQSRYERTAPNLTDGGHGGTYNAGYLGLNYRIYGDRLKITGVEYARMDGGSDGGDFDGWTWLSGVRVFW
jgi:hypothetical protein